MTNLSKYKSTRSEAFKSGDKHYFTGKECIRGHIALRSVDDWACMECSKIHQHNYEQRNKKPKPIKIKKITTEETLKNRNTRRRHREGKRRKTDLRFKFSHSMRLMLHRILKESGNKKIGKTFDIVGYNDKDLIAHLERNFTKDMGWDNHGTYWHIDHVISISEYLDIGITDPKIINSLSNLFPIKKEDNILKSNLFSLVPQVKTN